MLLLAISLLKDVLFMPFKAHSLFFFYFVSSSTVTWMYNRLIYYPINNMFVVA